MMELNSRTQRPEFDEALRRLVLARAGAVSGKLLARLAMVSDDLDAGQPLERNQSWCGLFSFVEGRRSLLVAST
jgi:hypothetical protein